jgi:hypothetical protein
MAIMAINEIDDLFNGGLDSKMSFLNDQKTTTNNDGIYRVDLSKCKDKKKGWRSIVRFLPNLTKEGKVGESAIEKITHYVDIKNPKELSGWFDSAKNFNEKCALSDLYYTMLNSKNAILIEKSKQLKYSKKYYSYVLVLEDDQQPELVGKIMIFQYGKTIKDKISAEKNGEISGVPCNVFDLSKGKDFVLVVKEIQTGDETYPDYKMSMFKPETTSLPIYFKEKGVFKNAPLVDGKIDPSAQGKVRDFLLEREHELEEYSPKRLTEEQQVKITEITNFLTGKASSSFSGSKESKPSSDDFEFEDNFSTPATTSSSEEEDDFFSDL